jgi:hypothetical protein
MAEPEAKLPFDEFAGEPRNSDFVVYAKDHFGSFLIAVEAKADEPFGETVAEALAAAMERRIENRRSNGVTRIEQLATALFGAHRKGEPPLKDIRYQLLTACAGALCEAERQGTERVVLLIHEFITDKTTDLRHELNADDLALFLSRLSHGTVTSVVPGRLYGPFNVPGRPLITKDLKLFVGKAVRSLRTITGERKITDATK